MALVNIMLNSQERGRPIDARQLVVKYTGPSSYATGGDALTAANLGLSEIILVQVTGALGGYTAEFDYTNNKIKWYTGAGTEVTAATNLSTQSCRLIVLGR